MGVKEHLEMETSRIVKGGRCDYIDCRDVDDWKECRKGFMTASEVPMWMGDFRSKSATRLALEKKGLMKAEDLDDNEAVMRGKMREPIIRRDFASRHPELKVTYHPYRIYISRETPYMSCTLDGEAVAEGVEDSFIVIEIKSVGYRSKAELEAFRQAEAPAVKFYEQTLAQMYCTAADACHIVVELTYVGDPEYQTEDMPDHEVREFFYERTKDVRADMRVVVEAVEDAKARLDSGRLPDTSIATDDGSEVVVIQADVEVGRFFENFDRVKSSIEHMVEPYRGVQFTPDQARDAAVVHSELNGMVKAIDEKRKAIKKKYLAPYEEFERKATELKSVIEDVRVPIKEQMDEFDARLKEEKRIKVDGIIRDMVVERFEDENDLSYFEECGGVVFDQRWLNRTMKERQIREEVSGQINGFQMDLATMKTVFGDDLELKAGVLAEYARARSIHDAMRAKERILMSREIARRDAERMAEEKAREEARKARQAAVYQTEDAGTVQNKEVPRTVQNNVYTFTFRASHASQEEWKGLVSYMKTHGFEYEQLR